VKQLIGRMLQVAAGLSELPDARVDAYRRLFAAQGYSMPPRVRFKPGREPARPTATQDVVIDAQAPPRCQYLGEIIHREPCTCGAKQTVAIHACSLHRRCVAAAQRHRKIKDRDVRAALRVCETCPDLIKIEQSSANSAPRFLHPIARHVTQFAVGITSAPRPQPTLADCVRSVIAAGFAPTVFAEPGTPVTGLSCPVVLRPQKLGCFHNYLQTLKDLLTANPDADAIVVFQDDVIVARETRLFLEHDLWPSDKCGAVSLYSPDFFSYEVNKPAGFSRQGGKYLMGACAMVYPRTMAEAMITRHTNWRGCAKGPPIKDETKKKAVDTWIGHAVAGEKLHVYYPNPSLCQHVATTSAIGHGGNNQIRKGKHYRKSGKFSGEQVTPFEAMKSNLPFLRFNSDGSMRLAQPLSVVIPAWNCFDLTSRCLTALATNADVFPLDVIYVDNGSEPGTIEQVESLARSLSLPLRTISFPENRGFCLAANAGMKAAKGHVLLLNNDCYIHKGCLSAMMRHLLSDPQVASVGPLTSDGGSQSVKRHPDLAKSRGKRLSINRSMLVGFCQLKRKEALADVGVLDEHLTHGLGTDDDWAHRARAKGWKLLLACDAFVDHDHKSTFRRSGQDRRVMQMAAIRYLKSKGTWPQ